jgi:hypothetical protein
MSYSSFEPGLTRRLTYSEEIRRKNGFFNSYNNRTYNVLDTSYSYYNDRYYTDRYYTFNDTSYIVTEDEHICKEKDSDDITLKTLMNTSDVKINTVKDMTCSICQDIIKENTHIVRKLKCNHSYHIECIDNWLVIKGECPMCKQQLI